ncbi:MAG: hypothetical protein AB1925_12365 [Actinomycetota bacterium]
MSAPDPFGSPGWDYQLRSPGPLLGPHAAAAAEMVRRQAADRRARQEAAIRAELTERVRAGIAAVLDGHPGVDKARRTDIYESAAEAAVNALEQFYNDGRKAMQ